MTELLVAYLIGSLVGSLNRQIVAVCERLKDADAIRRYRWSLVPDEIGYELAEHNERLRRML